MKKIMSTYTLTKNDINYINKYFSEDYIESILEDIRIHKKEESIKEDFNRLVMSFENLEECCNVRVNEGAYLYGSLTYNYDSRHIMIAIKGLSNVEFRIEDNYCYTTDSINDLIEILPDIHIAINKGII